MKDHLWTQAGDALEKNKSIYSDADLPLLGMEGSGLYVAMDPFASSAFGTELSCISLNEGISWVDNNAANRFTNQQRFENIRSSADILLYDYASSFLSGEIKSGIAAVIRQPLSVNLRKSVKFSLKGIDSGARLDASRITESRRQLQSGNWCEALSVFANKYDLFAMSFMKAFGIKPEDMRLALSQFWFDSPIFVENRWKRVLEKIAVNTDLVVALQKAGLIRNSDPANSKQEVSDLIRKVLQTPSRIDRSGTPAEVSARADLVVRLFEETGFWKFEGRPQTVDAFEGALAKANVQLIERFAAEHPAEVALAKELLIALEGRGLAGMSTQY